MVKGVLEEISFTSNENVREETAQMLTALANIKDFHLQWHSGNRRRIIGHLKGASKSSKPSGHKGSPNHDFVGPRRAENVVPNWVNPLHQSVTPFGFFLGFGVSLKSNVVFGAKGVENAMDDQIEGLSR